MTKQREINAYYVERDEEEHLKTIIEYTLTVEEQHNVDVPVELSERTHSINYESGRELSTRLLTLRNKKIQELEYAEGELDAMMSGVYHIVEEYNVIKHSDLAVDRYYKTVDCEYSECEICKEAMQ